MMGAAYKTKKELRLSTMCSQELHDLEQQAGYPLLSDEHAHRFRIRQLKEQALQNVLDGPRIADRRQREKARPSRAPERKNQENPAHKRVVEAGGGIYIRGMMADLVLFNSPQTGSTLALSEADLTVEAVRDRIEKSNIAFGIKPGGTK